MIHVFNGSFELEYFAIQTLYGCSGCCVWMLVWPLECFAGLGLRQACRRWHLGGQIVHHCTIPPVFGWWHLGKGRTFNIWWFVQRYGDIQRGADMSIFRCFNSLVLFWSIKRRCWHAFFLMMSFSYQRRWLPSGPTMCMAATASLQCWR